MPFYLLFFLILASSAADEALFREPFQDQLQPGWKWIREDPLAWKLEDGALRIKIQSGNMWGPENSGRNLLVRAFPEADDQPVEISMTVENRPTAQYEQVDLVCYYDDSHMVKIGQELVDGQLSIVMGREEADRTRTITIISLKQMRVELKLRVLAAQVTGLFRPGGEGEWQTAGSCALPEHGKLQLAIQCYQGPKDQEHWAKIENFQIARVAGSTRSSPR